MNQTHRKTSSHGPHGNETPVIELAGYRRPPQLPDRHVVTSNANIAARHALVTDHVTERVHRSTPPNVAAALVLLRLDGSLDTSAIGVEPEFGPLVGRGLSHLAETLPARPPAKPRRRTRLLGGPLLLTALGFAAATYVNTSAPLDAALIVLAQASTAWISRKAS